MKASLIHCPRRVNELLELTCVHWLLNNKNLNRIELCLLVVFFSFHNFALFTCICDGWFISLACVLHDLYSFVAFIFFGLSIRISFTRIFCDAVFKRENRCCENGFSIFRLFYTLIRFGCEGKNMKRWGKKNCCFRYFLIDISLNELADFAMPHRTLYYWIDDEMYWNVENFFFVYFCTR